MLGDGALTFREFAMREPHPLATIHDAVLEFLRGRDDAALYGAQAVNAYVDVKRMSEDVDVLSPRAKELAHDLRDHLAETTKTFRHLVPQIPGNQWRWRFVEKIVNVFPAAAAKFQNVAESLRGNETDPGTVFLDNGIDDHGGAVNDHAEIRDFKTQFMRAIKELLFERAGGTHFFDADRARFRIQGHKIDKGATNVYGQSSCLGHIVLLTSA